MSVATTKASRNRIRRWAAFLLIAVAIVCANRAARAQNVDIPLVLETVGTSQRLAINVGIAGGALRLYLFDTGSSPLQAAYNPAWFPLPTSTIATNVVYLYQGGTAGHTGDLSDQVTVPYLSFQVANSAALYNLPTLSPGYQIEKITNRITQTPGPGMQFTIGTDTYYADTAFANDVAHGIAPLAGGFFGTFGASDFVSQAETLTDRKTMLGSVLGQSTTSGYIVAANGTANAPGGCSPCLILGLTPALEAQFTARVPWNLNGGIGANFPNSGANGSREHGVTFNYVLSGNGLAPAVWSGATLLDTGTPDNTLSPATDVSAYSVGGTSVNSGTTLTATGATPGAAPYAITVTQGGNPITYDASLDSSGNETIGIGFFLANSVLFDLQDQAIGYTPAFVTDQPITTPLTVGNSMPPLGLAGVISGSGGVTVNAGGIATLSGANTYTGATLINSGGLLAMAGTGSIAASSGVTANGVFDISQSWGGQSITSLSGSGSVYLGGQSLTIANASGAFSGVIADGGLGGGAGGSLVIAGGTQTLTGANSYTGGTTIAGGATLAINADTALGGMAGNLAFDNGTLTVTGAYATQRAVIVDAGGGTIAAAGPVSLDGPLLVDGPLTVGGALTLSGPLTEDNGTLNAASLTVAPGATLRGIGSVAAPTTVAGALAPGNSPGTLTFTAPVTMLPGSTTQFDIDGIGTGTGAGNYSRVLVTGAGNGFTAAGTLAPLLRGITGSATNTYTPPLGQSFLVVSAQGGVQGSYGGLTQPAGLAAGTRFDALYAPTALALVVTPQSYGSLALAGIAESGNQSAVGAALDAGRPAAGVAMTPGQAGLYAPLYPLAAGAIPGVLDSLAPTVDADGLMVWRDAWSLVAGAIGGAMETRRGGQPDSQEQTAEGPKGSTIWLTALGQFDSVGSAGGVPGYGGSTGGVVAGVDMPVLPWLTAGGALAFTSPQVSTKNSQTFSGQALQVTAYGSAHQGIFFLDGQFGGLFFQDSTTRPLPVYGVQANGQTSGTGIGGSIRAGAHLQVAAWQVEPSLGLAGLGLSQGGFTETQAGAANLAVGSQGLTSIQSVLAARVERRFAVGETMALVPTARIGWLHEFADSVGTATASFAGAGSAGGGAPFSVDSAPVGRDAALIGLGATLQTGRPVSLYLAYNGAFAKNANAQTLTGGISVQW
jgi:outer membrane autotransporter protein